MSGRHTHELVAVPARLLERICRIPAGGTTYSAINELRHLLKHNAPKDAFTAGQHSADIPVIIEVRGDDMTSPSEALHNALMLLHKQELITAWSQPDERRS